MAVVDLAEVVAVASGVEDSTVEGILLVAALIVVDFEGEVEVMRLIRL